MDQSARKLAQLNFDVHDPDYYEFEGRDKLNFIPLLILKNILSFLFITFFSKSSQIVYKQYKNGF